MNRRCNGYFLEGLDANLNREKLKTTLVPMPRTLSPYQPASWISRHSQDGEKVVKQESFFGSEEFKKTGEKLYPHTTKTILSLR
jgi:hypothetical protein